MALVDCTRVKVPEEGGDRLSVDTIEMGRGIDGDAEMSARVFDGRIGCVFAQVIVVESRRT